MNAHLLRRGDFSEEGKLSSVLQGSRVVLSFVRRERAYQLWNTDCNTVPQGGSPGKRHAGMRVIRESCNSLQLVSLLSKILYIRLLHKDIVFPVKD